MNIKHSAETLVIASAFGAITFTGEAKSVRADEKEVKNNVLFIICDDLRPELNCYGHSQIKSPNIDRLASEGVLFNRAYCNIPVSGASRASFLTGLRPTRNAFELWNARVDHDAPDAVTLPEVFQKSGYRTISNGKVFHHRNEKALEFWDKYMPPKTRTPWGYQTKENISLTAPSAGPNGQKGFFYEHSDAPIDRFVDWKIAEKSIRDLKELKETGEAFFMAVGFVRPHLPFVVPDEFWELYDHEEIVVPDNYTMPSGHGIPKVAFPNWAELRSYSGIPAKGPLDEETARMMIHGYYAAVSFVDSQVGRVLDALRDTGLEENTTVILIGDHGWNLGEHASWCKHCIFNDCLHATMMIKSPEVREPYVSEQIVEFVDLYPTLVEAAGLEVPETVHGESLIPLLENKKAKSKGYAVCRWADGFTLVKDRYSYTEWWNDADQVTDCLLFDHLADPDENHNVIHEKGYSRIVKKMSEELKRRRGENYLIDYTNNVSEHEH